jgi:hypothetical protein
MWQIGVRNMCIYKEKKEKHLVHFSQINNHTLCSMPGHHGSPISYEGTHTSQKKHAQLHNKEYDT